MSETPKKPVIRPSTFDSFKPKVVDVSLEFGDHIEVMEMRTLSYMELQAVNKSVPDPQPPMIGTPKGPEPDFRDTAYQKAMSDAVVKRQFYYLAKSLQQPIPGDTDEEKVAFLQSLDSNYTRLLISAAMQLVSEGDAALIQRAVSFQPDRTARDASVSADELVKTAMEQATEG